MVLAPVNWDRVGQELRTIFLRLDLLTRPQRAGFHLSQVHASRLTTLSIFGALRTHSAGLGGAHTRAAITFGCHNLPHWQV